MAEYIPVEYLAYEGKTLNLIARQVGSNYSNLAIFLAQMALKIFNNSQMLQNPSNI